MKLVSFGLTDLLVAGLDASPPASTHELTIPNDVSNSRKINHWLLVLN